jgi:hypothetical protein
MTGRKRECPSCASEIPADQDICYICGYEFPARGSHKPWVKWVALIIVILFLYPLIRILF